jgi:hypothetical protein
VLYNCPFVLFLPSLLGVKAADLGWFKVLAILRESPFDSQPGIPKI